MSPFATEPLTAADDVPTKGLMRAAKTSLENMASILPNLPEEMIRAALSLELPGALADFIGANILVRFQDKQALLDTFDPFERLEKAVKQVKAASKSAAGASLMDKLTGKVPNTAKIMEEAAAALEELTCTCVVCDSINDNMGRYLHTFFHLYQNDTEFRKKFDSCKGMCIPHAAELLRLAASELPGKALPEFTATICRLETEAFDRMQEDVSWFCRKFDYRYYDEPWYNSRDAVERTVNKLRGWCVGAEPNPKE